MFFSIVFRRLLENVLKIKVSKKFSDLGKNITKYACVTYNRVCSIIP